MAHRVLVGVDYTEQGALALERALTLSAGGELHVVHVVESVLTASPAMGNVYPAPVSLNDAAANLGRHLDGELARLAKTPVPARVVSHVAVGRPADVLIQLASDLQADFIVIGTHGRHGIARLIMGSTAERVVRWAPCPVVVERRKAAPEPEPVIEPACPMCLEERQLTGGQELWCAQHRQRHGRRHTVHATEQSSAFPSAHSGLGSVS
jgi:nucleotide-binding universal stress UspA family protein